MLLRSMQLQDRADRTVRDLRIKVTDLDQPLEHIERRQSAEGGARQMAAGGRAQFTFSMNRPAASISAQRARSINSSAGWPRAAPEWW